MNGVTSDSAKVLTEKLSLARELATLRPELEHLRTQATYQQAVLAEKLALERQVSTLEVELEAERRASKTKKSNNHEKEVELQNLVDELQKEMVKEKRESSKARKDMEAELQGRVDGLQKELAKEKRDRKKSRVGAEMNLQDQVDNLENELNKEKREAEKIRAELETDLRNQIEELQETLARQERESAKARKNVNSDLQEQMDTLQQSLNQEKKETEKLRKELKKSQNGAKSDLDERMDAMQQDLVRERKECEKLRKELEKSQKTAESESGEQLTSLQENLAAQTKECEKLRKELKKSQKGAVAESDVNEKLEVMQQDLAREKKEAEKFRKEAEKERKTMETQHTILESKLEQFRTKLRCTKDTLKETQAELTEAKTIAVKASKSKLQAGAPVKESKKRAASRMEDDTAIGTPDGGIVRKRQTAKKGRADQTMLGEKSTFSITPFLNRTMSVAPDSPGNGENSPAVAKVNRNQVQEIPEAPVEEDDDVEEQEEEEEAPTPKLKGKKKVVEKSDAPERPILAEGRPNVKARKPAFKPRVPSKLSQVTEEENEENAALDNDMPPPKIFTAEDFSKPAETRPSKPTVVDGAAAKKKRKLGDGKTVFDNEDDGEAPKRPAKITLGASRLLTKGGLAGPKGGLKGGLAAASGFGGFSPLKKDKRGVNASFLG